MLVSELQLRNAEGPMLVTLAGIEMLVSELHWKNASVPMLVTLFRIVTLVKLKQ